jgi:hypothetical protein
MIVLRIHTDYMHKRETWFLFGIPVWCRALK